MVNEVGRGFDERGGGVQRRLPSSQLVDPPISLLCLVDLHSKVIGLDGDFDFCFGCRSLANDILLDPGPGNHLLETAHGDGHFVLEHYLDHV